MQTGHVCKHDDMLPDSKHSSGPRGAVNTATKETNEEINNGWRMKASLSSVFFFLNWVICQSRDHVCFDLEVTQRLMSRV